MKNLGELRPSKTGGDPVSFGLIPTRALENNACPKNSRQTHIVGEGGEEELGVNFSTIFS